MVTAALIAWPGWLTSAQSSPDRYVPTDRLTIARATERLLAIAAKGEATDDAAMLKVAGNAVIAARLPELSGGAGVSSADRVGHVWPPAPARPSPVLGRGPLRAY